MKLESLKKREESLYKPKVIEINIFPPTWLQAIKDLQNNNWENKRLIKNIYKYREDLWEYMKNNDIVPHNIIAEIEKE